MFQEKNGEKNDGSHFYEENSGLFLEELFVKRSSINKFVFSYNKLKISGSDRIIVDTRNEKTQNSYLFFVLYFSKSICVNQNVKEILLNWYITDLKGNKCMLHILGEASDAFRNAKIGNLYIALNPVIISDKYCYKQYLSVNKASQIIVVGKVEGFSFCKARMNSGTICRNPTAINTKEPFCVDHLDFKKQIKNINSGTEINDSEEVIDDTYPRGSTNYRESLTKYSTYCSRFVNKDKYNSQIKKNRLEFENKSRLHCDFGTLSDLNSKLLAAIRTNCKNDILDVIKSINGSDISRSSILEFEESGILDTIISLKNGKTDLDIHKCVGILLKKISGDEMNIIDICTGTNQVKKFQNKNIINYATVFNDVQQKISVREKMIKKENVSFGTELLRYITVTKNKEKVNNTKTQIVQKIDKAISLKTASEEAIKNIEKNEVLNKLRRLDDEDKKESHKSKVVSIHIKDAVVCRKCDIWTEREPNMVCKEEHPEEIFYNKRAVKESWLCKSCNFTIYSINGHMNSYCPMCRCDTICNLKRRSIYKLKKDPIEMEMLIVRDEDKKK